ncbi:hypothetical protein FJV41_34835 [Myxococcus llanfairpwllgwyngyllgogerychwyrndrobwllllantysiliogogogochensis]|uniref:Lipoprotein n=1 Tax=Myxococcus llanfairpwllgwyngyllgogerychwyrndrobwllllantysiliogogogochensis TaxID=2590453 RepID=A0A540WQX5_9BACT|nr:hypothetical protein [Myxococcus llanfairpwllgwyngyllgogerychwyrndrobwllllantysiliogogogochensis]TQF11317.1 hypothetical protein FJV41_34835 [Myxococcus llanfairpwllgwyngyllgogerychwyrndrobwllllantysiliogogogochensis]
MNVFKRVVWVCAAASLAACGGPEESPSQVSLGEQESALTTTSFGGCTFTISYTTVAPPFPPVYVVKLTRQASGTCPYPAATVDLGQSYNTPDLNVLGTAVGLSASFSTKGGLSGSSPTVCSVRHIDPATLATIRDAFVGANFGRGSVYGCRLDQTDAGTTLVAYGTKTGLLPGEPTTSTHSNWVATYYNFFTSTTPGVYYTY